MYFDFTEHIDLVNLITDAKYAESKHIFLKKMDDLFVAKYDKSKLTTENINWLGFFRSVIISPDGRIMCMAPNKSINFDVFSQSNKYENCFFQEFIEGTMINIFYDNFIDDWNITTRSTIGAKCNFNMDSKITYRYMFLDAMNHIGMEFEHLDKQLCYSFVLQHPENRIVMPIIEPNIYLIKVYRLEGISLKEQRISEEKLPLQKNHKFKIIKNYTETQLKKLGYMGNSWEELIDHFFSENLDYKIQGIVIYNERGERTKIRSGNYEKVKHLKGNSPKLQYRYYQLRQQGAVKDFLKYYPEYKETFSIFRNELHKWTNQLYQNYIICFIKKQKPLAEFPYNFKTHMYKIHEIYLFDLKYDQKYVNKSVVVDYVNNLPPAKLMYSVNHIKKQFDTERKIVTSDLKVLMKVD